MYQSAAHKFLRNPNVSTSILKRAWSRKSAFENTLTVLEDPETNRKLYLIGTTNSSTVLATRTKTLIEELKPQSVHVQTCLTWYQRASTLQVDNQEQFNKMSSHFRNIITMRARTYPNSLRGLYFKFRFYGWLLFMNTYLSLPPDFNFWRPGLEMLWGIKAAEKVGAQVKYFGAIFNTSMIQAMSRENNIGFVRTFRSVIRGEPLSNWRRESTDFFNVLRTVGGSAFSENIDNKSASWIVKWFERLHPEMKVLLVDREDERLFNNLYREEAETIVAIVNQWHVPGVVAHWRRATNTEIIREPINPIGDMDINAIQEGNIINDMLRSHSSALTKTEPAAWSSYLTHYHKSVMEPERERHVFFLSYEDPNLNHGLFNQENTGLHGNEELGQHSDHSHVEGTKLEKSRNQADKPGIEPGMETSRENPSRNKYKSHH